MKREVALVLSIFISTSGCAAIRESNERYFYNRSKHVLMDTVPYSVRSRCGFRLDLPLPGFEQLGASEALTQPGVFHRLDRIIGYDPEQPKVIVHEAQHDFLSYQSKECLEQVAAYYAQRIVELEDQNDHLMVSNGRSLLIGRR